VRPYDWQVFTHLVMRVRGDGRPYQLGLRMDRRYDLAWLDIYSYTLFTRGGPYWQIAKVAYQCCSEFYKKYILKSLIMTFSSWFNHLIVKILRVSQVVKCNSLARSHCTPQDFVRKKSRHFLFTSASLKFKKNERICSEFIQQQKCSLLQFLSHFV